MPSRSTLRMAKARTAPSQPSSVCNARGTDTATEQHWAVQATSTGNSIEPDADYKAPTAMLNRQETAGELTTRCMGLHPYRFVIHTRPRRQPAYATGAS